MTAEPSPRPWRVADYAQCPGLADVFDASGSPSGLVAGELKPADAALIVDAVNERDKLRNLVRSMANLATCLLWIYEDTYNDEQGREFARCERGMIRDALRQIEGGAK